MDLAEIEEKDKGATSITPMNVPIKTLPDVTKTQELLVWADDGGAIYGEDE